MIIKVVQFKDGRFGVRRTKQFVHTYWDIQNWSGWYDLEYCRIGNCKVVNRKDADESLVKLVDNGEPI